MDSEERIRLRRLYSEMPEEELIEMLLIDKKEYEPDVYEMLLAEAYNRGIERKVEERRKTRRDTSEDKEAEAGKEKKLVVVAKVKVITEADLIRVLLASEAIECFFNECAFPFYRTSPIDIYVKEEDVERAQEIIERYLKEKEQDSPPGIF